MIAFTAGFAIFGVLYLLIVIIDINIYYISSIKMNEWAARIMSVFPERNKADLDEFVQQVTNCNLAFIIQLK